MSIENPFEPIMEGLKDLNKSFAGLRDRKEKEAELRIKATEVYSKITEAQGKQAAKDRLSEAVKKSKYIPDPALAQAFVDADQPLTPLINTRAIKGIGGTAGGGGGGGGDGGGGGGGEFSSMAGMKWLNAKSMDKLKARLAQEIPAIALKMKDIEVDERMSDGQKAQQLQLLSKRQDLLTSQYEMMQDVTGKKSSYSESLKKIRTNVGDEQFKTIKENLAPHAAEFRKIMEEEGYPQDVLDNLERGNVLEALEKTGESLDGDAFVGWYKTIKPTVEGIKRKEAEMNQLYNIIGNADSKTLQNMYQDKGISDFERQTIKETYILRRTGDVLENVTGKVLGPIFPIDVTSSIKKRVGNIPQPIFQKRKAGEKLEESLEMTAKKRLEEKEKKK